MESYIIRVYRGQRSNSRRFAGTLEEVESEEKKAFTNLKELWNILNSIKKKPRQLNNETNLKCEKDRRMEPRTKREIPFVFIHDKRKIDGCVMNRSESGFNVEINERIDLPAGRLVRIQMTNSKARAEVRWAYQNSVSLSTVAGFAIVNGECQLENATKDTNLIMRG